MAIVVEDGTGLANAECYEDVANVKAYHLIRTNPASVSGASDGAIEAALREVTVYLDGEYGNSYPGYKRTSTQSLSWPRLDAENEGWYVQSTIVPQEMKDVSSLLVEKSLAGALLVDVSAGSGGKEGELVKVGPITVQDSYASVGSTQTRYKFADAILAPLLVSNQLRMVRG